MNARTRLFVLMAGATVVYVLAGLAGLHFALPHPAVTVIWPPAGIAVATLLLLGLRAWPAAAAGAFVTNLLTLEHAAAAAAITAGNTFSYVAAAWLTMRVARGRDAIERGADLFRFAFVAAIAAPVISATAGVAALRFWSLGPPVETSRMWVTWWLGDAAGVALYAPLCLLFATRQRPVRAGSGELTLMITALVLLLWGVVGLPADLQREVPFAFLLLPLMAWSAFRVDSRSTAIIAVVMSIVGVYRTQHNYSVFSLGDPADALMLVQAMTGILGLLMLAVSAEVGVRRRVESEMRALNESLERRVRERTAEVTRMRDRLVEAQSVAQIGSWEWDVTTNRLWWSDELCRIFDVRSVPDTYEAYLQLLHPDDRRGTEAAVAKSIRTGEPFTFEHRVCRPDGEVRVLHARGRVEFDDQRVPRRMLGTGHDITDRLRVEEARAQLIEEQTKLREAEESNRAKDAFLAVLSHELRTPLNAALGWTHILRETMPTSERHDRVITAIYRNLQLQTRIVSDILDITRITKGELSLERETVDLCAVFDVAVDMLRDTASARGVSIEVRTEGTPSVIGDSRRLQQVAWNLLSNAVKFAAEQGRVTISILETVDGAECSVEDDGPGIAPSFLPYVFEQFRQADSSTTRAHGGLGLGLAIAQSIVAMHEGTIAASNRPGGGARFTIRLPRRAVEGAVSAGVPV